MPQVWAAGMWSQGVAASPPSPAAGARNFLLAGRAHPPMNGNNPWHLAPEVCKAVDNQALLSSLPHSQPSAEGNQGRWGLCLNQEPDSAPGRGLGQPWQRRWQQRPQRAPVYPKSITQHAVAESLFATTKAHFHSLPFQQSSRIIASFLGPFSPLRFYYSTRQCALTTQALFSKHLVQKYFIFPVYIMMVSPHQPGTRSLGLKPPHPCSNTSHGSPLPRDKVKHTLELIEEAPEAALQPPPWVPRGMGLTQSLAAPTRPSLSLTTPFPAAPFLRCSSLARASSSLRPPPKPLAWGQCLLCNPHCTAGGGLYLGTQSQRLCWVSLRLDLRPIPIVNIYCGPPTGLCPSHAFTHQILKTKIDSGFLSDHSHFSDY